MRIGRYWVESYLMNATGLIVAISSVLYPIFSIGQKIDGVYVGTIFTESNAFVLSTKGEAIVGNVYLTQFEKFTFLGTFNENVLAGTIYVPNGNALLVSGQLLNDSLDLDLRSREDSTITKRTVLKKISSKANYDLTRLFVSKGKDKDPLLIGKWELVRKIGPDGAEVKVMRTGSTSIPVIKYYYEYLRDGTMNIDKSWVKYMLEESNRQLGHPDKKVVLDDSLIPTMKWETSDDKLITDSESKYSSSQSIYTYSIKDDTLTITNYKGGKEIMVRKIND